MPLIHVSENQDQIKTNLQQIEKTAEQILNVLGYTDAELSIVIVNDEEMAGLNSEYRGVDSTTDVLSFPMQEGDFGDVCPEMLGDVVISAETAFEMSRQYDRPLPEILDLLLVHGILHLVGYDHEGEESGGVVMRNKTVELLRGLGRSEKVLEWWDAEADGE
jgi:probable rRNA maturation factor